MAYTWKCADNPATAPFWTSGYLRFDRPDRAILPCAARPRYSTLCRQTALFNLVPPAQRHGIAGNGQVPVKTSGSLRLDPI